MGGVSTLVRGVVPVVSTSGVGIAFQPWVERGSDDGEARRGALAPGWRRRGGIVTDTAIDVVVPRTPEGLGFQIKVRATGRVFRIEPTRCPGQPRYWCFRIYRCTSAGMADATERPWYGAAGMTRDELPAATQAIRADVEGWLAEEGNRELRGWLLAAAEPNAAVVPPTSRARTGSSRQATAGLMAGSESVAGSAD